MKRCYRSLLVIIAVLAMAMSMCATVFADENDTPANGKYALNSITGSMSMINNALVKPALLEVNGEDAVLTFSAGGNLSKRYDEIYVGSIEDITDDNKDTIGIKGTLNSDGTITFSIPLKTSQVSATEPLYIVLRYNDTYVDSQGNSFKDIWYEASSGNAYYLTLGALTPIAVEELDITNTTKMFSVVKASIESLGDEQTLVVALSASGYHELFKGTYEQAVSNGTAIENWIHGHINATGKWEFAIPINANESYIPLVSISDDYYQKYLNNENDLARAFYPRQLKLDRGNKTLITGDYDNTFEVSVENSIPRFNPGTSAELQVIGGPNSNEYRAFITLHMGSASMDKVKSYEFNYKNKILTEGNEVIIDADADNTFVKVPVLPAILENGSVILKFHSANNNNWYNRKLTINLGDKKAIFSPLSEEEEIAEEIKDAKRDAKTAVAEAKALDTSAYSQENAQAIANAITVLEGLLADDTATAAQINEGKATLENAILKATKDAAQDAAAKAKALDTSVYSQENTQAIADAITALEGLLADDTATAEQIAAAKQALADAIKKANADKKAADEEAAKKKAQEEAAKKAAAKKAAIAKVQKGKVIGLKVKAGKKKATVTWKKNKVFAGYKLKYKIGKKTKTLTIKSAKKVKKVIKKLKTGKVIKVQIRGYKKLYGKMYYGKWSVAKKAKIK